MMEVLKRNNFITGLDIHYTKCNDISSFNFEEFTGSGSWMDFGGYDTEVDIEQLRAFIAVLNNEVSGNVEARTALNYLIQSIGSQKADVAEALGTRSLQGIADALSPFAYATPTYERYMMYLNEITVINRRY